MSQETGVPLDTLGAVLESMGFARVGPDEPMREDELAVVPLLRLGLSSGTFDHEGFQAWVREHRLMWWLPRFDGVTLNV